MAVHKNDTRRTEVVGKARAQFDSSSLEESRRASASDSPKVIKMMISRKQEARTLCVSLARLSAHLSVSSCDLSCCLFFREVSTSLNAGKEHERLARQPAALLVLSPYRATLWHPAANRHNVILLRLGERTAEFILTRRTLVLGQEANE